MRYYGLIRVLGYSYKQRLGCPVRVEIYIFEDFLTPVLAIGVVRDLGFGSDFGTSLEVVRGCDILVIRAKIMLPRMRTRSAGRPATKSLRGGTGVRVGRGEKGRRPREGNDERVDDMNGQGNDQGLGANGGVEGVNRNVEGVNGGVGGAPDF
nr:hypothetical protein [Tanacetum cinerariifolium]